MASGRIAGAWRRTSTPVIPGIRWSDMIDARRPVAAEDLEGLVAAVAGDDPVVDPEQVVDRAEDLGLVVDDQERRASTRA